MRRRDLSSIALVLLPVVCFLVFVWASRHPDAPTLRRAEAWPVVGPAVRRLRQAYLTPSPTEPSLTEAEPASGRLPEPSSPLDHGPTIQVTSRQIWVRPGTPLLAEPREGAQVLALVDRYAALWTMEERPPWVRGRFAETVGWLRLEDPPPGEPPLGNEPEPPRPLPGHPPDPEALEAVRDALGVAGATGRLGPYSLYTDVKLAGLIAYLDLLASGVEDTYRRRYSVEPVGNATEAVALFAQEETYRSFQERDQRIRGLPSTGHTGLGLVALYLGDRTLLEVGATLVHELTHLLNRRALGPALPPWLDEGMAEDLAWCRTDPQGRLVPGSFGGFQERRGPVVRWHGAQAALRRYVQEQADGRVEVHDRLLDLDWDAFVVSKGRELRYSQSALLVRFLLDGGEPQAAQGFRRFLRDISLGRALSRQRFERAVGRSGTDLDREVDAWARHREAEEREAEEREERKREGKGREMQNPRADAATG